MHASLHPYRLPLRAPLALAFGTLTAREGVLLRLDDGAGNVGWGEAAPLPGFSPETLAEAAAALAPWTPDTPSDALPPSARAAVDGALLELEAAASGRSLAHLLTPDPAARVALTALLTGDLAPVTAQAREAGRRGYRAVKLKVGGRPVEDDAARVLAVAAALGPDVALRLDANRAWSFETALRFADAVAGVPLALLEEPLAAPDRLPDFARTTALPLGLDESLLTFSPDALGDHAYARAVVLKPTLLGGLRACLRWADAARTHGLTPLVSGAFESGVGTRQAVALAAALGGPPAGLDPYTHLAADVLTPPLALDGPSADVAEVLAPRRVAV